MVRVSSKAKVESLKPPTSSRSSHLKVSGVGKDSQCLQLVVDHKAFNIRVSEDLLGANIFNHMAFYNGVEHGDSSGRSVSEKGMPASPSSPSVRTHGRDGKVQECSSASISSKHRGGGILSGPGLSGMGLGGEGMYLGQMGGHGPAGMLEKTRELGIGEGVGLDTRPS
ncbi:hypothetical protein Ancab_007664 [Ancistrocladus abbreviatus]